MTEPIQFEIHGKGVTSIEFILGSAKMKSIIVERASSHGNTVLQNVTKQLEENDFFFKVYFHLFVLGNRRKEIVVFPAGKEAEEKMIIHIWLI